MEMTDIYRFQHILAESGRRIDDIYCLGLLQSLMAGYGFLPITAGSLRPFCLVHMLNDIVLNGRNNIIEFGSGLSTILIGRLIKRSKLNTRLISVEHDRQWANVLTEILQNESIGDEVEIICAPLKESDLAVDGNLWYDVNAVNEQTAYKKFDMVIIDGPPAWQKGHEKARYPALPYIFNKLDGKFCIYLDDADRSGENTTLQLWQKKYGMEFSIMGGTLAYFAVGGSFYSAPI